MRDYAAEIDATDIWFLSRDTEAMFAVARQAPSIVGDRNISYVYSSRSACYPLVARHQHLFTKWRGRAPTDDDVKQGDAAQDYYRSMLRPGSKRILIVDIGWKGRVQRAIESALPREVSVFGYAHRAIGYEAQRVVDITPASSPLRAPPRAHRTTLLVHDGDILLDDLTRHTGSGGGKLPPAPMVTSSFCLLFSAGNVAARRAAFLHCRRDPC
jgi:hypothetical protein